MENYYINKDNLCFFNISEIKEDGTLLRFKESLIKNLGFEKHDRARFYGYRAIGSEIRFKTDSKFFDIDLEAYKEDCQVYIFFGDIMHKRYIIEAGKNSTLHIEIPQKIYQNYDKLNGIFNSKVIRIIVGYPGYIKFKGLNTFGHKVLLPCEDEMPKKSLVIYGSSISHGSEALEYVYSYAFNLSKLLGIDVINKSIPGSCQAEGIMIDYIKDIKADNYFIEFGVNVLGLYTFDEYKEHFDYIVKSIDNKKLYMTSVFDNSNILEDNEAHKMMSLIRDYVKDNAPNYIDYSFLPLTSLSSDLLHPSDYGQLLIALQIYKTFKNIY